MGSITRTVESHPDCMSCRVIGTGVSIAASVYLLASVYSSNPPRAGLHRGLTLAFSGAFAALGVVRAII